MPTLKNILGGQEAYDKLVFQIARNAQSRKSASRRRKGKVRSMEAQATQRHQQLLKAS